MYAQQGQQYAAGHLGGVIPASRVEIFMSAHHLLDMDTFSKSDPFAVVYSKGSAAETWKEIFRTETVQDNLNPQWTRGLVMEYYFETVQYLKFEVYDEDDARGPLNRQDFIGSLELTLSDIVAHGGRVERSLQNPNKRKHPGYIVIACEEIEDLKMTALFQVAGVKLDKKDLFGKSDPFLRIYKMGADRSFTAVHQTEVIKKDLNPRWQPFTLPISTLNSGDMTRPIKFEVTDWNKNGSEDLIGYFVCSLEELQQRNEWPLINPKKQSSRRYVNSGVLKFINLQLIKEHSFLEFVQGGLNMNLMIAIDYTASNGNPSSPQSLHHQGRSGHTEYAEAIASVGEILSHYDSDQNYPVYGFGAKVPPRGQVSHCFALNELFGNPSPEIHGIDGVLAAYYESLRRVNLYGPTNMATVIATAAREAAELHRYQTQQPGYMILLIITDGEITDMEQTTREIVNASVLPLSIIIVGVGSADFTRMDVLDADDVPLSYHGKVMARDIVQFTPYREVKNRARGQDGSAVLAREVLHELPGQVTSYFKSIGVTPRPPQIRPMASQSNIQYHGQGASAPPPPQQQQQQQPTPPSSAGWQAARRGLQQGAFAQMAQQQQQQQQQQQPAYQQPQAQAPPMHPGWQAARRGLQQGVFTQMAQQQQQPQPPVNPYAPPAYAPQPGQQPQQQQYDPYNAPPSY